MKYQVALRGVQVQARIGVSAEERGEARLLVIDVTAQVDGEAPDTDQVKDTMDYGAAADLIEGIASSRERNTLERLTAELAQAILDGFAGVSEVEVEVQKPAPPGRVVVSGASVRVRLMRDFRRNDA